MALAQIIGMEESEIEVDPDNMEKPPLSMPASFYQEISPDNRAEITMLKEKAAIMESKRNIERSKFMPDVALTGGYGWMNPNPYNGLRSEFGGNWSVRSEEHTSELQSRPHLVCRLLLEKKNIDT